MLNKILIVVTNQAEYTKTGEPAGLWLSELTHFYDVFHKANIEMDIASILGGNTPLDPASISERMLDKQTKEYLENPQFMALLKDTIKISDVDVEDYSAIYFTGGHATMWDFPDSEALQGLSKHIYENGGIVSAVCHGVGALLNIKMEDGTLLIKDKTVTGYSNTEEVLAKALEKIPFKLEDELKIRGANYKKALIAFTSFVKVDGRVITGQNPQSTKEVAEKVLEALK